MLKLSTVKFHIVYDVWFHIWPRVHFFKGKLHQEQIQISLCTNERVLYNDDEDTIALITNLISFKQLLQTGYLLPERFHIIYF